MRIKLKAPPCGQSKNNGKGYPKIESPALLQASPEVSHFLRGKIIAVDTETTGTNPYKDDEAFAVGFCNEYGEYETFVWPVDPFTRKPQVNWEDVAKFKPLLEDPEIAKVFHYSRFDFRFLRKLGITVRGEIHDSMIAARVCNSAEEFIGLKELAMKYMSEAAGTYAAQDKQLRQRTSLARNAAKKLKWKRAPKLEQDYWMIKAYDPEDNSLENYLAGDVCRTMLLWQMYQGLLEGDEHYSKTYADEMELNWVTLEIEDRGIAVYPDECRKEMARLKDIAEEKLRSMRKYTRNFKFNPGSWQQLLPVLQNQCQLRVKSTGIEFLRPYDTHPFVLTLLQWREATKGIQFFEKYLELMVPDPLVPGGWVIHTELDQVGTCTGRYSSRTPNMQQLRKEDARGYVGYHVRRCFGPRPGYVWLLGDYNQLELRIFAHFSQDKTMLEAISKGEDIHAWCADAAWGKHEANRPKAVALALEMHTDAPSSPKIIKLREELFGIHNHTNIPKEELELGAKRWLEKFDYSIVAAEKSIGKNTSRSKAKNVNFGKIFGGGPNAVAKFLMCDYDTAAEFLKEYDEAIPTLKRFSNSMIRKIRRDGGEIINAYGRRTVVDMEKAYTGINYIVQGSAADLMKDAMRRIHKFYRASNLDAHIVLTVHDEVISEINKKQFYTWVIKAVKNIMENHGGRFSVPTTVDLKKTATHWENKHDIKCLKEPECALK
jgi:DNA polymerase I-like protein with 3'-5' exonuclease and polymerase domains